jgi:glucosylglycerate phosphorylase
LALSKIPLPAKNSRLMSHPKKDLQTLLVKIYPQGQAEFLLSAIWRLVEAFREQPALFPTTAPSTGELSERDIFLITYADQFMEPDRSPLQSLATFLEANVRDVINGIHILPFYPYSSDDGFSVIDYYDVSPKLGTWQDVSILEENYRLMFDLVANHVSSQSAWFQGFLRQEAPYKDYFINPDPGSDLSGVVRPRSSPVLTPFQTLAGTRQVWTTFSSDQIDLNYANPDVLLEMIKVLLFYVSHGARIIRLDAIAYLWKVPGTSCIHLQQTHLIVKVLRAILDACAPSVLLITETNVPHRENVSYFGNYLPEKHRTDEAQLVYQFPLAPLVMHTFITGDVSRLTGWVKGLPDLEPGTAFFNFMASHDGIGIRPAQALLQPPEIQALVDGTLSHGGLISYGSNTDGSQSPYELNISWYDALNDPAKPDVELDIRRFLASQAILLLLPGVPAIYVHSLFGSRNCLKCLQETGRSRSLNREKFLLKDLQEELNDPHSLKARILSGYRHLLQIRQRQPAFHPAAKQQTLNLDPAVFAILRTAADGSQVLCLTNVTSRVVRVEIILSDWGLQKKPEWTDLLAGEVFPAGEKMWLGLGPYQSRWLKSLPVSFAENPES